MRGDAEAAWSSLWDVVTEGTLLLKGQPPLESRVVLQCGNADPEGLDLQFFKRNQKTEFLMSSHFLNVRNSFHHVYKITDAKENIHSKGGQFGLSYRPSPMQ